MTYQTEEPRIAPRPSRAADWANIVLGAWLFVSPWILGLVGEAASNAWVLGAVIFVISLSALGRRAMWQEWANLVLGAWTFVAPWVLGFYARGSWDHWIVGAAVFIIAAVAIGSRYRGGAGMTHAHGHR